MGTGICKIVKEMAEIIEPKVGNPKNSVSRNWAILSHPWNLTFFEDEIFQFFPYLYGSKVPKWNFAHILLWKKVKNIRKTPKNTLFTPPWLRTTLLNDPVDRMLNVDIRCVTFVTLKYITVLFWVRRLHQGSTEESVAADWSASHHNTSQSRTVGPSPSGEITDLQGKV